MTPQQFLALYQPKPEPAGNQPREDGKGEGRKVADPSPRAYRAFTEGANETFLTIHTAADGLARSLPYNQFSLVTCDERGGTYVKLFGSTLAVELKGRNLGPLQSLLRSRACAHVHEFSGGKHDPPDPMHPVILEVVLQARTTAKTG